MTSSRFLLLSLPCAIAQSKVQQLREKYGGAASTNRPQATSSRFENQFSKGQGGFLDRKPLISSPARPDPQAPVRSHVRRSNLPPRSVTASTQAAVKKHSNRQPPPPTGNKSPATAGPTVSRLTYKVDGAEEKATSPTGLFVINPTAKEIQGVDENLTKCTPFNKCSRPFDFSDAEYVSLGEAGLIAPTAKSGGGVKTTANGAPVLSDEQKKLLQKKYEIQDFNDHKAVAAALLAEEQVNAKNAYSVSITGGAKTPTITVSGTKFEVVKTQVPGTPSFTVENQQGEKQSGVLPGTKVAAVLWDGQVSRPAPAWLKNTRSQKAAGPVVTLKG